MSAAADKRGLKRICMDCGTRFYDMNKRPIICPNCDTEFTGEIKVKSRRGRVAADPMKELKEEATKKASKDVANDVVEEDDEDETAADAEVEEVSLDDVKDAEDDVEAVDEDDEAIDLGDDELDSDLDADDDITVLDNDDDDDDDLGIDVKLDTD